MKSRSSAREAGLATAELCRQHGITEQTYYRWKAKYSGMDSGEAKKLKQLEDENWKLKHVVADLGYQLPMELNHNPAL